MRGPYQIIADQTQKKNHTVIHDALRACGIAQMVFAFAYSQANDEGDGGLYPVSIQFENGDMVNQELNWHMPFDPRIAEALHTEIELEEVVYSDPPTTRKAKSTIFNSLTELNIVGEDFMANKGSREIDDDGYTTSGFVRLSLNLNPVLVDREGNLIRSQAPTLRPHYPRFR